jgi:hypothetical protein
MVRSTYPVMYNINVFSLIKKIEDKRKKTITSLKNVKNEIAFIQFIQERQDYDLDASYKDKLVSLFGAKKDLISEVLVLQSAYSMIDLMFLQEIKNGEIIKRRCCRSCKMCCEPKIIDPERINPFIAKLIDPFKRNEDFETQKRGCCVSLCCMTKRKNVVVANAGEEELWFKSDENDCGADGKCGVSLVKERRPIMVTASTSTEPEQRMNDNVDSDIQMTVIDSVEGNLNGDDLQEIKVEVTD